MKFFGNYFKYVTTKILHREVSANIWVDEVNVEVNYVLSVELKLYEASFKN